MNVSPAFLRVLTHFLCHERFCDGSRLGLATAYAVVLAVFLSSVGSMHPHGKACIDPHAYLYFIWTRLHGSVATLQICQARYFLQ